MNELINILQSVYLTNDEECLKISKMEWMLGNLLEWEQMKCTRAIVMRTPELYAYLVSILYKKEGDKETTPEENQRANQIYSHFNKMQFCPAQKGNTVQYEELKEWGDQFRCLLQQNRQEYLWGRLMGELLSYSPAGKDGLAPCEAVRQFIEENFSPELKNAYVIAEANKRGVHTVDAGQSERKLAEQYKEQAQKLNSKYPHTAEIFYAVSEDYLYQAESERRLAEDVW